ncbi:MAG TPA: septal ring lytic transglycosylase RlpA family protein [Spirochaetia bacterium]|nr:septal ring lytic transglycosylase RlpA family protein [Spirochaetales bacterium]HOT59094.1 septal ring lytic transglycosylase RlpA family protein [Spirochaetales bacterium]HQK33536.1 septal ring lytic transglycosylase RlpA family protein [Spirochaetales bacterium]HRS65626.1 septal ring lytic transglycosylase RlpA family protein [Spirochaetia bacterium]
MQVTKFSFVKQWNLVLCIFCVFTVLAAQEVVTRTVNKDGSIQQYQFLYFETGTASWYGAEFHGRKTANGELFDKNSFTAAHKTLPFGTIVLVRNLANDREVIVRINDRGPFVKGRIIDLSEAGARELGMLGTGTAQVVLYIMQPMPSTTLNQVDTGGKTAKTQNETLTAQALQLYKVQIGSFSQEANARAFLNTLLQAGLKPVIEVVLVNGKTYYRVTVTVTESDLALTLRKLADLGVSNPLVTTSTQ